MSRQALSERERFPELFVKDKRIDRRQCKREVPMKVLVCGMMRTGTACQLPYRVSALASSAS